MGNQDVIGVVLSGGTTDSVRFQLTELGEELVRSGRVREGMLVLIRDPSKDAYFLARVETITPVNEYFTEGDPWSEVRRKNRDIPLLNEVARKYVLVDATLLGEITKNGLGDVGAPPFPGSKVEVIEDKADVLEEYFGIRGNEPGVILYGSLFGYSNLPVPLNVENITMHVGVFGETGSGKSYGVGHIIELLSEIPDGVGGHVALPTIVVDANGDYIDYWEHFREKRELGNFVVVERLVFKNSSIEGYPHVRDISIELEEFTAREIAELVMTYKAGGLDVSELQISGLEEAIKRSRDEYGVSNTELFVDRVNLLKNTIDEMVRGPEPVIHHQTAKAIKHAVEKFRKDLVEGYNLITREPTLSAEYFDEITKSPWLAIIDFSTEGAPGVPTHVKQLVIGYVLKKLFKMFTKYKQSGESRYILFVIEEAQNYAPNLKVYPVRLSLAREYLSEIATQGRKFGISLCLVSQRPSFIDPVVMSMLNTWIIHRISPEDVGYIRKVSGGLPQSIERRLTSLPRGVAVITGQMNMLGFSVLAKVGKRKVKHRVGRTDVVKTLRRYQSFS